MEIDYQVQKTLGIIAGTLAMWRRQNPQDKAVELTEDGLADAEALGMEVLAASWLRMYYELRKHGLIAPAVPPANAPSSGVLQ